MLKEVIDVLIPAQQIMPLPIRITDSLFFPMGKATTIYCSQVKGDYYL